MSRMAKSKYVLYAFDPGKVNFAWSRMTHKGKITKVGMLRSLITNLKDPDEFNSEVANFRKDLLSLIEKDRNKGKTIVLVLERFMVRGRFGGNLNEVINIMIGILCGSTPQKIKVNLITAATWKNHYKRKEIDRKIFGFKEHISDSMLMGLYFLFRDQGWSNIKLYRKVKKLNRLSFRDRGKMRYKWRTKNAKT